MLDCSKYIKLFSKTHQRSLNTAEVFLDFLDYTASKLGLESGDSSFLNDFEKIKDKLDKDIITKYDKIYLSIKKDINENINDYLGSIYMMIGRNNKSLGQFFTPWHIANLMSSILNIEEVQKEEKDIYTISDPTCGSGVILIANYNNIKNSKLKENYVVIGQDLDINCVRMTYIQLSMLGVPAYVIHGNTLTNECRRVFITKELIKTGLYKKMLY